MWYFGDGSSDGGRYFERRAALNREQLCCASSGFSLDMSLDSCEEPQPSLKQASADELGINSKFQDASSALRCLLRVPPPPPSAPPPDLPAETICSPPCATAVPPPPPPDVLAEPICSHLPHPTGVENIRYLTLADYLLDGPGANSGQSYMTPSADMSQSLPCHSPGTVIQNAGIPLHVASCPSSGDAIQSSSPLFCREFERAMFSSRSLTATFDDRAQATSSQAFQGWCVPTQHVSNELLLMSSPEADAVKARVHAAAELQLLPIPVNNRPRIVQNQATGTVPAYRYRTMESPPILAPQVPMAKPSLRWMGQGAAFFSNSFGPEFEVASTVQNVCKLGLQCDYVGPYPCAGCDVDFQFAPNRGSCKDSIGDQLLLTAAGSPVYLPAASSELDLGSMHESVSYETTQKHSQAHECATPSTFPSHDFVRVSPSPSEPSQDSDGTLEESIVHTIAAETATERTITSCTADACVTVRTHSAENITQKGALRWADLVDGSDDDLNCEVVDGGNPKHDALSYLEQSAREEDVEFDDVLVTSSSRSQKTKARKRRRSRLCVKSLQSSDMAKAQMGIPVGTCTNEINDSVERPSHAEVSPIQDDRSCSNSVPQSTLKNPISETRKFGHIAKDSTPWRLFYTSLIGIRVRASSPAQCKKNDKRKMTADPASTKCISTGCSNFIFSWIAFFLAFLETIRRRVAGTAVSAKRHPVLMTIVLFAFVIFLGRVLMGPGADNRRVYIRPVRFYSEVRRPL